jgi:hypothetical protein
LFVTRIEPFVVTILAQRLHGLLIQFLNPLTHIWLQDGGMIFFGSKYFFTSSSFPRYRDTLLFADNLTTDEAHFLGNLDNTDAKLQRKATFMDKLSLARKSWFDKGTNNVQQRGLKREKKGGGNSTVLQERKYAVLKKLGEETLSFASALQELASSSLHFWYAFYNFL